MTILLVSYPVLRALVIASYPNPLSDLRQFADVPVSAEGLNEQNAGVELSAPDIDVILFVAKSSCL
jgi:hypothetical protein